MADAKPDSSSRGIRKPRKSRGRGLRATTGCLICKRRHVKCDEARPQCGPCAKGQRSCLYADAAVELGEQQQYQKHQQNQPHPTGSGSDAPPPPPPPPPVHEPLRVLVDACQHEEPGPPAAKTISPRPPPDPLSQSPASARPDRLPAPPTTSTSLVPHVHGPQASPVSPQEYGASPGTESSVSTRLAPLSWFELLANDAANADRGFWLSPQDTTSTMALEAAVHTYQSPGLRPNNQRERESFQAASFRRDPEVDGGMVPQVAPDEDDDPSIALPDDASSWNTKVPIELSDQGQFMFMHFVRTVGTWLDFFDPSLQFSTVVPHLALRNIGLMKALLALSARNLSLWKEIASSRRDGAIEKDARAPRTDAERGFMAAIDRHVAVQYYYETLHYVNKAMHYPSYARSAELICTSLLISTYEMIDGSNHDWERHLKGVFWIQRFQNNNGECGGIRQAVWWSWLRQDVWVAMRERRRVFSFYQPKQHLSTLTASELTCRAHYLLSQCVNYASREESESADIQQRLERGNELLFMLQEWQDYLPREFSPLPVKHTGDVVFPPIWIHPPPYAAALQLHSLARILVVLHRPSIGGLQDYRAAQRLLAASVSTVCGIARTVKDNMAACLISLNCLFGAGMSVHAPHERAALLDLVESFQWRLGWPAGSLRKELEAEYQKDELSAFSG